MLLDMLRYLRNLVKQRFRMQQLASWYPGIKEKQRIRRYELAFEYTEIPLNFGEVKDSEVPTCFWIPPGFGEAEDSEVPTCFWICCVTSGF